MTVHYRPYSAESGWGDVPCEQRPWKLHEYDQGSGNSYTAGVHLVTCHDCLEIIVRFGEQAVQRIIELDLASEAEGPSSGINAEQPRSPVGRQIDECHCNEKFRTAEDYRDHLPCWKNTPELTGDSW